MTHSKYFLTILLFFFVAAGVSAVTTHEESKAKSKSVDKTNVTLFKNPNCQCCSKWAAYMEENGFSVTQKETSQLAAIKDQYGVPSSLGACHTAIIDGYVVEGHVPVEVVNDLLDEQPDKIGIALPGMPAGSPGMPGIKGASFEVSLFDKEGEHSLFGTY